MKKNNSKIGIAAALSLTLGLVPFIPEPHIWGKLKWLAGGAKGMEFMDYFDVALHGFPWIFLIVEIIKLIMNNLTVFHKN